jgi:phage tail-like protein
MTEASLNGSRAPRAASNRRYLRSGLPAVYREGDCSDFVMRFLGAIESVLDPVVTLLDNLPQHFQPRQAPDDLLTLLASWLALEQHEARPLEERRELVRHAAELAVSRGTKTGVELALKLGFPGIPLRVEDHGCVRHAAMADDLNAPDTASFVVYCDVPLPESKQRDIARFVTSQKPVHVSFKLRVRAAEPERSA